jgi:phosphatidylglycerophosphatase GEP4
VKRKLHAPVLFHNTPKPGYACIASIRRYFSSLQHPVQAEQLIIVGDRVFTDVVLANRLRALDRGSGLVHMCCRTVFERGGTVGREKDEASRQRSEESGPLAIWTTGVWQREAMVMRWCEKRLVAAVRRWTSQNETQGLNSPFLKDLPPTAVRARSWKWWQS